MGVAALFAGLLWATLLQFSNSVSLLLDVYWLGVRLTQPLLALFFGLGALLYCLAAAVHYLLLEFVRAKTAEQRGLEAQLMAQEAQLRMLRTQIDPHFLFNSLNSISALTSINAAGARQMTVQLASFFRQSLSMEAHKHITLHEELVLIRHFLAIEQVRFGERLQIAVRNPVDADQGPSRGNGVGLDNVRQRLASAYGHEASVHWARRGGTFEVTLSMPAQTGDTEEA